MLILLNENMLKVFFPSDRNGLKHLAQIKMIILFIEEVNTLFRNTHCLCTANYFPLFFYAASKSYYLVIYNCFASKTARKNIRNECQMNYRNFVTEHAVIG